MTDESLRSTGAAWELQHRLRTYVRMKPAHIERNSLRAANSDDTARGVWVM
jgi:hypothetical protein